MKNAASCVKRCELQDTPNTRSSNAPCGSGSIPELRLSEGRYKNLDRCLWRSRPTMYEGPSSESLSVVCGSSEAAYVLPESVAQPSCALTDVSLDLASLESAGEMLVRRTYVRHTTVDLRSDEGTA